jgi:hypothetical protein
VSFVEPRQAALHSVLRQRLAALRLVQRADGDRNPGAIQIQKAERRAAFAAEDTLGEIGTLKARELAARQLEIPVRHAREGAEQISHVLLAHAAMADAWLHGHRMKRIANRAALAPAGQTNLDHCPLPN